MEDMLTNKDFAYKFFDKLMRWVIVADISIDDILAFYHAAKKYGRYPLNF